MSCNFVLPDASFSPLAPSGSCPAPSATTVPAHETGVNAFGKMQGESQVKPGFHDDIPIGRNPAMPRGAIGAKLPARMASCACCGGNFRLLGNPDGDMSP